MTTEKNQKSQYHETTTLNGDKIGANKMRMKEEVTKT